MTIEPDFIYAASDDDGAEVRIERTEDGRFLVADHMGAETYCDTETDARKEAGSYMETFVENIVTNMRDLSGRGERQAAWVEAAYWSRCAAEVTAGNPS